MKCEICNKEKLVVRAGAVYEYSDNQEPRRASPSLLFCRECFADEWNSNSMKFDSRADAERCWDNKLAEENGTRALREDEAKMGMRKSDWR